MHLSSIVLGALFALQALAVRTTVTQTVTKTTRLPASTVTSVSTSRSTTTQLQTITRTATSVTTSISTSISTSIVTSVSTSTTTSISASVSTVLLTTTNTISTCPTTASSTTSSSSPTATCQSFRLLVNGPGTPYDGEYLALSLYFRSHEANVVGVASSASGSLFSIDPVTGYVISSMQELALDNTYAPPDSEGYAPAYFDQASQLAGESLSPVTCALSADDANISCMAFSAAANWQYCPHYNGILMGSEVGEDCTPVTVNPVCA